MEREVSTTISLAVVMIAISVVISIVAYTMQIGTGFSDDIAQGAADVQTKVTSGQLRDLSWKEDTLMTTASIYNICSQEHKFINSLTYYSEDGSVFIAPVSDGGWGEYSSASDFANGADPLNDERYIFPEDFLRDKLTGKTVVNAYKNSYDTFDLIIEKQVE